MLVESCKFTLRTERCCAVDIVVFMLIDALAYDRITAIMCKISRTLQIMRTEALWRWSPNLIANVVFVMS